MATTPTAFTAILSNGSRTSIPKAILEEQRWKAGEEIAFIPKVRGVLLMPVPDLDQLSGIAKGARKTGYRAR